MITLKDCIGLDLGTSKFRFYKKGKLVSEIPSKIIREDKSYGPIMREGKIACFIEAETLVRQELKKINPPVLGIFHKSIKCFISVPSDMNKTALRAFLDLAEHAGSRQTYLLTDSLIIARGLGIDIPNSVYTIVDCGADKTSITTMDKYEIVSNRIIDYAGYKFDESIITYIRRQYNIDITPEQAEELKIKYVNVGKADIDRTVHIKGKDRSTNQDKDIRIQASELSDCIAGDIEYIKEIIVRHTNNLNPSIVSKIKHNGIYCVGNSFKLKGFINYLAEDIPISAKSYTTTNDYMRLGIESLFSDSIENLSKYLDQTEFIRSEDI